MKTIQAHINNFEQRLIDDCGYSYVREVEVTINADDCTITWSAYDLDTAQYSNDKWQGVRTNVIEGGVDLDEVLETSLAEIPSRAERELRLIAGQTANLVELTKECTSPLAKAAGIAFAERLNEYRQALTCSPE